MPSHRSIRSRPIEILLIEDNPDDVQLTGRLLASGKVRANLHCATDASSALQLLRDGLAIDLVLLDLRLPVIHGLELLQRIKSDPQLRRIPVAVLSASDDPDDIERVEARGAAYFLNKPLSETQLFRLVRDARQFWLTISTETNDG